MRIRATVAVLVFCVIAGGAAGCGNSPSVQKNSTPGASSPVSKPLPFAGAPAVAEPLDTARVVESPCAVATDKQIAEITGTELKESHVSESAALKDCIWNLVDGLGTLGAGVILTDVQGLSSSYEQHAAGQLAQFKVMPPIDGYPAVMATNATRAGYCALRVGLRDDITYLVTASMRSRHPQHKDPCAAAVKIAALAIKYLKVA